MIFSVHFLQVLESVCKPIVTKPKPKVEPPKDEGAKEGEGEKMDQGEGEGEQGEEEGKQGEESKASGEEEQPKEKGGEEDMDVD